MTFKWSMIFIEAALVLLGISGAAALFRLVVRKEVFQGARLTACWADTPSRSTRALLLLPVLSWLMLFLFALLILLFVSGMCLMYAFALLQGEWFQLLDSWPRTAGNVVVHLVYPLQMVLFSLVTFHIVIGGFQLVLGPIDALSRFHLRIEDLSDLAARLAGLLALTAGLEIIKILVYSLLVEPQKLGQFFARNTLPKADPLGAALLAASLLSAAIATRLTKRNRS
jgi:hypothetical protein